MWQNIKAKPTNRRMIKSVKLNISQGVYSKAQQQNSLCSTIVASTDNQEQVLRKSKK
jgi:protein involved in temperature-dependent protein secretion